MMGLMESEDDENILPFASSSDKSKTEQTTTATIISKTEGEDDGISDVSHVSNGSSSSVSSSSTTTTEEEEGEDDMLSIQRMKSGSTSTSTGRQKGQTLKQQRKRKRKGPKAKKTSGHRVPVRTICTTTCIIQREQKRVSESQPALLPLRSRSDNLMILGSGAFILYNFWMNYHVLEVVGPTLAVICGVAIVAAILIHIQDRLFHQKLQVAPSLLLPLPGRPMIQRPNPTTAPNGSHLVLHFNSKRSSKSLSSSSSSLCKPLHENNKKKQQLQHPPQQQPISSLFPIVERKLEDEYDYWWNELDSQTQYYALILGYTQTTWDSDFELEDLACEERLWDEMTEEERAAALHFGYDQEDWEEVMTKRRNATSAALPLLSST